MARILMIVAALALALGAGIATRGMLVANRDVPVASAPATVAVLVVTEDLVIGQTVSERNLTWQQWPKSNLNPNYITHDGKPDARKSLAGATVRQPLFGGEPVTSGKLLKRDNASVLAVVLEEGMRAVTIKVDEAQGLAGLVRPGDRVDVILTHKVSASTLAAKSGERSVSEAVARNARVLAVGQEVKVEEDADGKRRPIKSVTVEVDERQAEAVTLGRSLGALSLSLRSLFADENAADEAPRVKPWTSDEDISNLLRQERRQTARALVAARPLTAGSFLTEGDLSWEEVKSADQLNGVFVDTRDGEHRLNGALLLSDVPQGRMLTTDMVVRPGENRFVPRALRPGHRAVSVTVAKNTAVGSFVSPGDIVDVIFTDQVVDASEGARVRERSWSETVARGVRVLSVEVAIDPQTQLPKAGGTVTLEARPAQVETIALAANMGNLTLVLRALDDVVIADGDADGAGLGGETSPTLVAERRGSSPGFTTDTEMSLGLRSLIGGASRNATVAAHQMLMIKGRERSMVTLND